MGYETRCIALGASDLGADHIRKRYWLRAHAHGDSELRGPIDAEVGGMPKLCGSVWSADPRDSRVSNGAADRVERLKATGDGQVVCVAVSAWRCLESLEQ